ncbi:MAG TPA: 4-alpha-glucanotransferase [Bryobacteraceae bacterium]|nr:4-alpha-glucanotransferase [Bryobacteraceae bacterium]
MTFPRSSGILLHPTSLPGRFGIGDLGPEAYGFIDFLADAGQKIWQVLPLGPTGYGDSPYQLFSAFAGNPLLISPDRLAEEGLLTSGEMARAPVYPAGEVDYGSVIRFKFELLRAAYGRFGAHAELESFRQENAAWLGDYALFMAVKAAHGGESIWSRWEPDIAARRPDALAAWRSRLADEIAFVEFTQYMFSRQWRSLHDYARERGVRMMGDLPIYVAHDSADVWSHPDLFQLDDHGDAAVMSGVPPDYFSATGQLWGNPIYRWDRMAESGFGWWIDRVRAATTQLDMVRVDHFRGLEAYWEVPAGETTARNGRWVKGPGAALFEALQEALGELPIVAENLGVITPEVEAIRTQFGFPGMAILQFAFGKDPQAPDFKPHNYPRDRVAYTGTHDNDTTVGWWSSAGAGDSTRTAEDIRQEREFTRRYLATDGSQIHWVFIRALMASVANTVLFPLQDVLGLGSEARMNTPAVPSGNWRWRCSGEALTPAIARRLKEMVITYDR